MMILYINVTRDFYLFQSRRRDEKSQEGHTAGDRRVPVPEHDRLLRRGHCPDVDVALLFASTFLENVYSGAQLAW